MTSPARTPAGVVGLGLMGTSIATALLAAGHPVIGWDHRAEPLESAAFRILRNLEQLREEGLLAEPARGAAGRFHAAGGFPDFAGAALVMEATSEDLQAKRAVIRSLEQVTAPQTIIGVNTSALPVTLLQKGAIHPERVAGIHWAEPAHITRFMEIIQGDQTAAETIQNIREFARWWGKEPTVVSRDIRGFIANRLMYAMFREAFFLVENGYATLADVDRSVRNDMGWWLTLAGPFRFMDLTGIPAYLAVMRELLPELSCSKEVPKLIEEIVGSGGRGVSNAKGFYQYTPEQARQWEEVFVRFSYDVRKLAEKYPENAGD